MKSRFKRDFTRIVFKCVSARNSFISQLNHCFEILYTLRQYHCRDLCKISKGLDNLNRCYERTRFREILDQDKFRWSYIVPHPSCFIGAILSNIRIYSHNTATSNGRHGVSNYWSIECLFSSLFRLTTKNHQKSALLSLCERNPPVTGGFPTEVCRHTICCFLAYFQVWYKKGIFSQLNRYLSLIERTHLHLILQSKSNLISIV